MFGPPGHAYVYFTYGMHFCANVVCSPPDVATGILLRAGRIVVGEELARRRRGFDPARSPRDLARGPARLCQALAINRSQDGKDLLDRSSNLRLRAAAGHERVAERLQIEAGPRVGVSQAADIPWRFWDSPGPHREPLPPRRPSPQNPGISAAPLVNLKSLSCPTRTKIGMSWLDMVWTDGYNPRFD